MALLSHCLSPCAPLLHTHLQQTELRLGHVHARSILILRLQTRSSVFMSANSQSGQSDYIVKQLIIIEILAPLC